MLGSLKQQIQDELHNLKSDLIKEQEKEISNIQGMFKTERERSESALREATRVEPKAIIVEPVHVARVEQVQVDAPVIVREPEIIQKKPEPIPIQKIAPVIKQEPTKPAFLTKDQIWKNMEVLMSRHRGI